VFDADGARPQRLCVAARGTLPEDLAAAERAEVAGRAAGMAALAARCKTLWEVEPVGDVDAATLHAFCALLASVALGPVMPPDESTLYGVRGAMQRAKPD
jgi:hypothetical protein